jgi:DNA mismatch repair ATPase MutS
MSFFFFNIYKKIESRLDMVEALYSDIELREMLRSDALKRVPDLDKLTNKFLRSRARLQV